VVLPAPFGPMSEVIAPRCTSSRLTWTACSPPKVLVTPSATRMGSGLATPGSAGTPGSRAAQGPASAVTKHHLPPVSQDPLRPVDHQEHEPGTDQREPDRAHLGGADEAGRDEPRADGLAE